MQCAAFKRNGHPCRGYGSLRENGLSLCHLHEHFYEDAEPIFRKALNQSSIFQTEAQRSWVVRMLKAAHKVLGKQLETLILLRYNLMSSDRYDAQEWYLHDKYTYLYMLCLRAKVFPPVANMCFWKRSLIRQLRVVARTSADENLPLTYKGVIRILLIPLVSDGCPWDLLVREFISATRYETIVSLPIKRQIDMWLAVLNETLLETYALPVPGINFKAYLRLEDFPSKQIYDVFLLRLQQLQRVLRREICDRIAPIKEELMAAAWHPRRVEAALEAGLNLEDL